MNPVLIFWLVCLLSALAPVVLSRSADALGEVQHDAGSFPGWPETFEGDPWIQLNRQSQQASFAGGFPGKTALFQQKERQVVLRWVTAATRGVHPASDCFRAWGYRVGTIGLVKDRNGRIWSEFTVERKEEAWTVRERIIVGLEDEGGWSDVSSWYWAARNGRDEGPWWVVTIVEPTITKAKA
ncbi:MAG TPA: hypothetical protein PLN52_17015 [Opitutaceae bacterium]|nr:hypothetical protein [Opitutaceae bacterium]